VLDGGCRMGDDHVAVLRKAQMHPRSLPVENTFRLHST
jgi:hypothetical protein